MATVALQFEDDQILVASSRAVGNREQIQNLFSIELNGDRESAAKELETELAKHGLSRSEVIIVVSRANVEMRELTIPPAPDEEVPDMVRFMARNEFASLNENWALDYLPMTGDSTTQRTVLATGISAELQNQFKAIVEPAGLKIKHIVLRPFALIDLIRSKLAHGQCKLLVDPNGDQTDMTIVDGDALITTRTVRMPTSDDANRRADSMLSEVKRTLASSRKTLGSRKVTEVLIMGTASQHKMLEGNLRGQLELNVEFVSALDHASVESTLTTPENEERYASLIGSLVRHHSANSHTVDFVNPRRPVIVKKDYSKWYLYAGAALAASLLVIAVCWWTLSSQSSEIARNQETLDRLIEENKGSNNKPGVDQILGEISKVDDWKASGINWLEEIYQYSERALTPDDVIVDLFDAAAGLRADSVPTILINTRLTEVQKESELIESLAQRPFEVKFTRGTVDSLDKDYPLTDTLRIQIPQNKREKVKEYDRLAREYLQKVNAIRLGKSPSGKSPSAEPAKSESP